MFDELFWSCSFSFIMSWTNSMLFPFLTLSTNILFGLWLTYLKAFEVSNNGFVLFFLQRKFIPYLLKTSVIQNTKRISLLFVLISCISTKYVHQMFFIKNKYTWCIFKYSINLFVQLKSWLLTYQLYQHAQQQLWFLIYFISSF